MIKVMPNGEVQRKTNLLNPTIPIPPESSVFHGIYDEDVKDKPTFKEVAREYARFLEGADLSGFSILKMDVPMLVEEFIRAGVDFDYQRKRIIDSQKIFHLMERRTLSAAYQFYCQKDLADAHSAEADARATYEILEAQIMRYPNLSGDIGALAAFTAEDDFVDFGRRIVRQGSVEVFNFGKHKGKAVRAVLREEPQYYDWMMKSDFSLHTKQKLSEIYQEMMLKKP